MKIILALCYIVTLSVLSFGQNLEKDLRRHFNKFSIVQINDREALQKAHSQAPFSIQTKEKNFQFILRFNDIRTEDYRAEYTDRDGKHTLPRGEVFTYKSTLIGESKSVVALTVDGTKTEGYLATEHEGYFIESAKKYSSYARADDKVIYQVKDKVNYDDDICGLDEIVLAGMKIVQSTTNFNKFSVNSLGRKILKVATEADKEFVLEPTTGNGSPVTANAHILSVMNQVDAVFELQLDMSIAISFQHAWVSNAIDPYEGITDAGDLITAFTIYWNTNFPSSNLNYRRNIAHLFTLKQTPDVGGLASPGTTCSKPDLSYSLTSSPVFWRWIIVAHELGHNLNASHSSEPQQPDCENTIMQRVVTNTVNKFCAYSINQVNSYVENFEFCLDSEPSTEVRTLFDFDADGEADISLFRPSNGFWYIQQSTAGFYAAAFGLATDKLSPADFDGDGKTDIAVFRNGNWYIQRSSSGFIAVVFGASGDIPVPGDLTGDGKAELIVFRPTNGYWYNYDLTNNQFSGVPFGINGDKPLIGDFDGDGKIDYAVFHPSTVGEWRIQQSSQGFSSLNFGYGTDIPVPADFDDDGKTDIAVFRPSNGTWYLQRSNLGFAALPFGQLGDIPNPADYDGDGKADISVFRPSTGAWHRINSSNNGGTSIIFGQNTDTPIPSFNIVQ